MCSQMRRSASNVVVGADVLVPHSEVLDLTWHLLPSPQQAPSLVASFAIVALESQPAREYIFSSPAASAAQRLCCETHEALLMVEVAHSYGLVCM